MAVKLAAKRTKGIIKMHPPQVGEPDYSIELLEGFLDCHGCLQVITACKHVAGVEAHSNPSLIFNLSNQRCQLFKPVSQIGSLSGSVFNHSRDVAGSIESHID